jgi:TPP-dependent pyruvate/acetoin dehydrogenase alpha subunit
MNRNLPIGKIIDSLIAFEQRISDLFEDARIPYPIHLSGGNEKELIEIFSEVQKGDYIFSTHRSHYHYLLAGGSPDELEKMILEGDSMHVFDRKINFLTSSIVAGGPAIAAGVAFSLKKQGSSAKVWCFVGDGTVDEGHFYEAVRYVDGHDLPCIFIVEDNDRSVESPKSARYGNSTLQWPACVRSYPYSPTYPHVGTGTGNMIDFGGKKIERSSF